MSSEKNIIKVYFKGTHLTHSKTQYQYNHGMILHFADLDLPQAFETHFANKQHGNSKTVIGSENKVEIPDEYFWTGANEIYAWVYLHSDVDDGETVYEVRIPLVKRAKPSDEEPLPEQQSAIDRAIAELSHAVETTNADAEQTSADREAVTALRDEVVDLRDEAEQSAQTATAKANEANESASSASESEQNAHDYADDAKRYAENAFSSKETAVASASDAERAKEDAEQARDDAQDAKSDAIQIKQDVVGLKDDVVNLKDDVIVLKEQTDTNVTHYPKVIDEYWHVWNASLGEYVNTNVKAQGDKGDKGDTYELTEQDKEDIAGLVDIPIQIKYVKDDGSDNGGVIEGSVTGDNINVASGYCSHAEGEGTSASGVHAHTEGYKTIANKQQAHAEGNLTTASGTISHAEGAGSTASGMISHAEGDSTEASGSYTHSEGRQTKASGSSSHAEGQATIAVGSNSHAEGQESKTNGHVSHAEGLRTQANGNSSHAEGDSTVTSASSAHAEGLRTTASGSNSHAEGGDTVASGLCSHAEGTQAEASGNYSHAENSAKAQGDYSHAEGGVTFAVGGFAHSEGYNSIARGDQSHAEGNTTVAGAANAHAEGDTTIANATASHAEGSHTLALSANQHVQGKYNISDNQDVYAHIVGNGTDENHRSNAYTLDWQGNGVYAGKVTVGSAPTNDMDVATKKYVDDIKGASIHICSSEEYDSTTRVPTIQNPDERTFYLVPNADGTSPDLFVEWAYVNNAWEMFGSMSIDLSGYLTDVQVDGTSIVTDGVANVPIASSSKVGVVRTQGTYGLNVNEAGVIYTYGANSANIKAGTDIYRPINSSTQHEATFYGLAKASGDATQSQSSNAVGTYTDEAKASIQTMLGVPSVDDIPEVPVEDVQINGTSILENGVANVPVASNSVMGVAKFNVNNGVEVYDNTWRIVSASSAQIKGGAEKFRPVTPQRQHESAFYGLAKAAGDTTQSQSSNTVGNYTPEAKGAIQSMLGIDSLIAPTETNPFSEAHAVGDLFIINGALYRAKTAIAVNDVLDDGVNVDAVNVDDVAVKDVQINDTSIVQDGVANIPIATRTNAGVVKVSPTYGLGMNSGYVKVQSATAENIKEGTNYRNAVTPSVADSATFYGLAKAAGHDEKDSTLSVGTYTDEAKASIQTMLGVPSSDDVVSDVQLDGTSILSDGVANVPTVTASRKGVVSINTNYGIGATVNGSGILMIQAADVSLIKSATGYGLYKPIVPTHQHESTFYGLAKASGDTTQSQSSNAVGQYTDEAKTSIKQMLGVIDSYDSLVVNVTGTDPVITGNPSYRYNCGEVASLTVTPPSSGTIDIIFTSGTTPTVLDLPSTVKMPSWWIGTEANTTYEMCITDGVYCGVMSWDV